MKHGLNTEAIGKKGILATKSTKFTKIEWPVFLLLFVLLVFFVVVKFSVRV
jgi:hypothetical protein